MTNALAGSDTIELPDGNYVLTIPGRDENAAATGDLDITDTAGLSIEGASQNSTTIDACKLDRVIDAQPYVSLQVQGVTITGGDPQWDQDFGTGGGIYLEDGDLTVADSTISTNIALNDGGGIYVDGNLTINRSTFQNNNSEGHGGGAYADYGDLTVNDSTFVSNSADGNGGALGHGESDTVTLSNSTISNNYAGRAGGGIVDHGFSFNDTETVRVNSRSVEGNTAGRGGGGIANFAVNLTVSGTTASDNHVTGDTMYSQWGGGGIESWAEDSFPIERSTIQDNKPAAGSDGGGVVNWLQGSEFAVVDSTVIGNKTTSGVGGGISSWASTFRVGGSNTEGNVVGGDVDSTTGYPYDGLGGGIYKLGLGAEITNTTLSGNIAEAGSGGGLDNDGDTNLRHVTLYDNRAPVGGNLASWGGIVLENTLLTGNTDGGELRHLGHIFVKPLRGPQSRI